MIMPITPSVDLSINGASAAIIRSQRGRAQRRDGPAVWPNLISRSEGGERPCGAVLQEIRVPFLSIVRLWRR